MWYVYNKEDTWQCGWSVEDEAEAIRQCSESDELVYIFVG